MAQKAKKIFSMFFKSFFVVVDRLVYYTDILGKYFPRFVSQSNVSKIATVVFV